MSVSVARYAGPYCALWLCACAAQGSGDPEHEAEFEHDLDRAQAETLEELAARTAVPGDEERYLVEGDMMLSREALERYYENRNYREKAIVAIAVNNSTGQRFYAIRGSKMNIRYCVAGGWGGSEAPLATVQASLDAGARAWSGVAAVRFNHVTSADGSGCTQAIVGSTVDFVVRPNTGVPGSSYAWWTYHAVSEMALGKNVAYEAAVTHELGHVLGLDHEQDNDSSGLSGAGCTPAGSAPTYDPPVAGYSWGNQVDLTPFDNKSIMGYYNGSGVLSCTGGTPVGLRVSVLDGVGLRKLYGTPHFWPVVIADAIDP